MLRIPAAMVMMLGVALAALGVWMFSVSESAPGVVASMVTLICAAWLLSDLVRPKPKESAAFSVSGPARIGGEVTVTLRLVLPKKLELNANRQRVRFVIEEWLSERGGDYAPERSTIHEAQLPLSVPLDTVGAWETSWALKVPASAPPTMWGSNFRVQATVDLLLPYGSFGEITARAPVVILPEVAGE